MNLFQQNKERQSREFGNVYANQKSSYFKNFLRENIFPYIFTLKIPPITQSILDRELKKHFKRLNPGIVLDVGSWDAPYKKLIPHTRYLTLDLTDEHKPDIVSDVHEIKCRSNIFDTIIATEVLEHLYNPQKAINELHRILKPGGVCIASTRFFYPYHPVPKDYFRFTWDSLKYLFRDFSHVEVHSHGGKLQTLWQIINYRKTTGIFLNIFNPLIAAIPSGNSLTPLGFVVYARK